jgi:hypothetical protein
MATPPAVPSGRTSVDWKQYAADARDLFLVTSNAGPLAMRMWGLAWRDWMTAVITAQDHFASRWTSLVVEPGARAKTFDQMRQDLKQYMVSIAGIPEHAVLEYLQRLSECVGPSEGPASPESTFRHEAADFMAAAAEVYAELQKASASRPTYGGTWKDPTPPVHPAPAQATPAQATPAHAPADPLTSLGEKFDTLRAAQAKLGAGTAPSAS